MKPQKLLWNVLSVIMVVALVFGWNSPAPVVAQSSGPTERPQFKAERLSGEVSTDAVERLSQKSGIVDIVVELEGEPTAVTFAKARETMGLESANELAASRLQALQAAQATLLSRMTAAGIGQKVLFQTQRVFNGIYMKVDASKVREISRLPGVKGVYPLVPKELDNNYSVPLIGAPQVWQNYFVRGEGVKVGIIDTGIDYLHTDFGGPGTGYDTNDFTVDEPGFADGYPSAKVVGGYDFAGDAYDASNPASVPQPDPDPMDCNGHGSHVAGTVAGFGTNTDGTTYTGGYSTTTPFTTAMDIGPGVAPLAKLYALRVFGCSGSTNLTDAAIEWATDPNGDGKFDDRLDVINMSLGSSYGSEFDTSAVASNNAALVGVIVVASAGNSADTHYITGAPGVATRAISVASSQDAGNINTTSQFRVNTGSLAGLHPALEAAFGPDLAVVGDVTADLAYDSTNPLGCNAFAPGTFTGKVALISRGTCTFVAKVKNAQNAGAVAVIVFNNAAGEPFVMGGSDPTITIPSVMTSLPVGNALITALGSETVNVTLSAQWRYTRRADAGPNPALVDLPSSFTSRGPRRVDSALKPDISAPGDTIYSVAVRTGKYGTSMSGTSMAAPHMTGVMALMRQWKPTWTVEELKANVMNTASYDITPGATKFAPQRVGAGRVNVPAALTNEVVLYNAQDAGAVSVSFGAPQVTALTSWTKTVRVVNKGGTAVTYTPSIVQRTQVPGVTFELLDSSDAPLTSLTVPAGGSVEFKLKMTADPAGMTHPRDATMSSAQTISRFWMAEASGLIVLTPASGTALRLPYYAAPRPASTLRAASSSVTVDGTGYAEVTTTGTNVDTSSIAAPPVGEIALITAFELMGTSPNENLNTGNPALEAVLDGADLKYIGAMTDAHLYPTTGVEDPDAVMYFGIATHGQWSTLNEVEFDIYIDVNQDGVDDYVLFTWNYGRATGGSNPTDTFVTVLYNLSTGSMMVESYVNAVSPAYLDTVVFNNSVVVLPVYTADFLTSADSEFDFYVVTFAREADNAVDVSDVMTYDAAHPALDTSGGFTGLPVWFYGDDIPVQVDYTVGRDAGDLLLLYHHNAEDATVKRAEVVKVFDRFTYVPVILK
ncbi:MULTISPECIES: S8 family serine peptidase [Anaerolinea]|uniref:S8 family serine peptidase n=1 Tax=Anaerolinea TaxID=233189 RepID=UPI00261B5FFD|nr:S8 family serine peptidase [Anaerolinea thermophila]